MGAEKITTQSKDDFIDLFELAGDVWRQKWMIAMFGLFGIVAAILYLNVTHPTYTAYFRVSPAPSTSAGLSGRLAALGDIASIAGVSTRDTSEGASPFELYIDRLTSHAAAAALADDQRILRTIFYRQWDTKDKKWRRPPSTLRWLRDVFLVVVGQPAPAWRPPNAQSLQEYLVKRVGVFAPKAKAAPITTVVYEHEDREFALYLISRLNVIADAQVRHEALGRATQYATYLSQKLQVAVLAEHRKNLSDALIEQERSIMMASSNVPYAAIPIEPALVADKPAKPKPVLLVIVGLFGGLFFGMMTAIFRFLGISLKRARLN